MIMHETLPIIECKGLGKDYLLYRSPGQRALRQLGVFHFLPSFLQPNIPVHSAIAGLDIEIQVGERVGIVGRNGAGKTTFLKLITGAIRPSYGTITVKGEVHSLLQTGIGFDPEFTGSENIRAALQFNKISPEEEELAYHDIVEFCELGDHLHQPFKTYSAGMASRLQFATATAVRPDILVIDEVLGAGDSYFLQKSAKRMDEVALSGSTLLLVSHATQQILRFCTRVLWIEEGQVVMDGPALEVCNAYDVFIERRALAYKLDLPAHEFDLFADKKTIREKVGNAPVSVDAHLAMSSHLEDGRTVYRWPSNRGLKICSLSLNNNDGPSNVFRTGEKIEIGFTLRAEVSGSFKCRYLITFWSPDGVRVARIENDLDEFDIALGETRSVKFVIDDQPIARGEYLLSFSVYDLTYSTTSHGSDVRYDMLAHALSLRIEDSAESGGFLFISNSDWTYSAISSTENIQLPEK